MYLKPLLNNSAFKTEKIKRILKITICLLLAIYVYFILAFSNRSGFNHYTYYVIFALFFVVSFYLIIFGLESINLSFLSIGFFSLYVVASTLILNQGWSTMLTMLSSLLTLISVYFAFSIINNKFLVINAILFGFFFFSIHFYTVYFEEIVSLNIGRLGDYFYNQNKIAFQMFFASGLCWFLAINVNQKYYIIPFMIFSLILFLTGSRTFFMVLLLFIFLSLFLKFRKNTKKFIFIILFLMAVVFIVIQLPPLSKFRSAIFEMLYTLIGVGSDVSTNTRLFMAENAAYIGIRNLIFGIGTDGFSFSSRFGTYSHNNYFEILANFGLINLFLFYYIPGVSIAKFNRNVTKFQLLGTLLSICIFVSSLGTVLYSEKISAIFFAFIIFTYNDN